MVAMENILGYLRNLKFLLGGLLFLSPFCMPGDIRLVDGPDYLSGRLEVYHDGMWGTVCSSSFTQTDASIICEELNVSVGNCMHAIQAQKSLNVKSKIT